MCSATQIGRLGIWSVMLQESIFMRKSTVLRGLPKQTSFGSFGKRNPIHQLEKSSWSLFASAGNAACQKIFRLVDECEAIANRLLAGEPNLIDLAKIAARFDADYLRQQIIRMEEAVESDPALAIGTAKELIETCCKTILEERGEPFAKRVSNKLEPGPNGAT